MNPHCRFFKADISTPIFCQSQPAVFDLTLPRFMPELSNQLMNLSQTGSADGMPLGGQTARGIGGHLAVDFHKSVVDPVGSLFRRTDAQFDQCDDFRRRSIFGKLAETR